MHLDDFSLDAFSLRGRRALVTGGNTGLGAAFSVALARAGADVCVVGLDEDGDVTRNAVLACGVQYARRTLDLTATGAPQEAVDVCVAELGGLDIVVNSAGICVVRDVEDFDRSAWDPMIAVNLTAAFELAHHASLHMAEQGGGTIINIASLFSYLGGQGSPAYAASKAGIVGFTKAYCDDLGARNITVNAIAPGYITTDLTQATRSDPESNRRIIEHIPVGRWGDPADLMGAVVFLASPAAAYVSGHVLVVDGGYLVR